MTLELPKVKQKHRQHALLVSVLALKLSSVQQELGQSIHIYTYKDIKMNIIAILGKTYGIGVGSCLFYEGLSS